MMIDPDERLEELFGEASKLPLTERAAFLDRECGQDKHLKRQVEQLLDSFDHAEADRFLVPQHQSMLPPGSVVGNYKLLREIGSGSTGVVYEARHLALNKRCAVKILHASHTRNPQVRRRFQRELLAVGRIQHPNVVTALDANNDGEHSFLAMEYLEGVSLSHAFGTIRHLPVDAACEIAQQIAYGLSALAHNHLVHRDLSPSNVFLTFDGTVKLLDFGLVRLLSPGLQPQHWLTETGTSLGNPAYMSPEQQKSSNLADIRSDLYSLGCILYQMLAGCVPFGDQGELRRDEFPKKHTEEIPTPLIALRPELPAHLNALVMRLLAKNPDDRLQTAEEVLKELDAADRPTILKELVATLPQPERYQTEPTTVLPGTSPGRTGLRAIIVIGIVVLTVSVVTVALLRPERTPTNWESRPLTSALGREVTPCFSHDGKSIAYAWGGADGKNIDIYVKRLTDQDAEPQRISTMLDTELAPVWSPDDRYLAYWRHLTNLEGCVLVRVSLTDGREENLLQVRELLQHLDWSPDGQWLTFALTNTGTEPPGLYSWNVTERQLVYLAPTPPGWNDYSPRSSPDGSEIAFIRKEATYSQSQQLCVVSRNRPSEVNVIWKASGFFRGVDWTTDGNELIFSFNRSALSKLWRIAKTGGKPSEIRLPFESRLAFPAVARSGQQLAFVGVVDDWTIWRQRIVKPPELIPTPERLFATNRSDDAPAYSPDGKQIAFSSDRSGDNEIWLYDIPTHTLRQLTQFRGPDVGSPQWHPDGKQIVFDSTRDGNSGLYTVSLDEPLGHFRRLEIGLTESATLPSWVGNGQWIVFQTGVGLNEHLWKVPATGGTATPFTPAKTSSALLSIDGKRIYCLDHNNHVNAVNLDDGRLTPVSTISTNWNRWSVGRNGFYRLDPADGVRGKIVYRAFESGDIPIGSYRAEHVYVNGRFPGGRIAVSPDESELLYVEYSRDGSSIHTVDGFR